MQGFKAPGIANAYLLYDAFLQKMDDRLQSSAWLAGTSFSLADIALTPYVTRLDMLSMSEMWTKCRPHLADWFERIKARPTYLPQLRDCCPPDLTNDLATFGARSWPEVQKILQTA
jgi:glutathione S-transferase